ncbi:MAG: hypothetical protein LWX56_09210 [Ignavibacteria bacterium]|nr:hypothetical protein [Ignavibacteria bacterium]
MFIGHFGVGLGAKKAAPKVSLGMLFLAAQFIDLVWPLLLQLGMERVEIQPHPGGLTPLNFIHYPFTHSLLMVLIWAGFLGVVYNSSKKDGKGALVVGLLVLSHWILDLFVHRPDLPLVPDVPLKVGLGLWDLPVLSITLEMLLFAAGVFLYVKSTSALDKKGSLGFWSLICCLVLIHAANLFGPPPASVTAIGWAGHLQWLFVAWAFWVDKHRQVRV